jgi:hypothetical protein
MPKADLHRDLSHAEDGAELHRGAAAPFLAEVRGALAHLPEEAAGVRVPDLPALRFFLNAAGPVGAIAAEILGPQCRAVRAVLFEKTAATNWALGWHQDRVIAVKRRVDVDGFGPWTIKAGMPHVAPPFELLARMATLRVHLDDVPADNAPLLIAPGSHRFGRVPAGEIRAVVRRRGTRSCLAEAGDILALRHADSSRVGERGGAAPSARFASGFFGRRVAGRPGMGPGLRVDRFSSLGPPP